MLGMTVDVGESTLCIRSAWFSVFVRGDLCFVSVSYTLCWVLCYVLCVLCLWVILCAVCCDVCFAFLFRPSEKFSPALADGIGMLVCWIFGVDGGAGGFSGNGNEAADNEEALPDDGEVSGLASLIFSSAEITGDGRFFFFSAKHFDGLGHLAHVYKNISVILRARTIIC